MTTTCDANARKGTGTGMCDAPLDEHGNCPQSGDHWEVTVRDALAWLGIPVEVLEESYQMLQGRHGNPIGSALLDARDALGTATTAADVLARHGIDPSDPLAAVRAYDRNRARFDA